MRVTDSRQSGSQSIPLDQVGAADTLHWMSEESPIVESGVARPHQPAANRRGAPPITPGARPRSMPPINAVCAWALAVGIIGLWIPLVGLAGIVLGIIGLRRPKVRSREQSGMALAITGIVTGAGGLILSLFIVAMFGSIFGAMSSTRGAFSAREAIMVRHAANVWAQRDGTYPDHLAQVLLMHEASIEPSYFLVADEDPLVTGSLTVSGYDFSAYDRSEQAMADALAAVEATDMSEPFYQFGSWHFVRLEKPTHDGNIVFAWRLDPGGWSTYIMDDGSIEMGQSWRDVWDADAIARARLGLPAATPERD